MSWRQHNEHSQPRGKWRGNDGWHDGGPGHDDEPEMDSDRLRIWAPDLGGLHALETPCVLGSYSVDSKKDILFDNSMMPKLNREYALRSGERMKVELDLNRGRERVNGYTGTTAQTFSNFLQWILKNQQKLTAEDSSNKLMVDFVCTRGILKSIMLAPFAFCENKEMVILAQLFKGSIYMKYKYEDYEGQREKEKPEHLAIYGHKFEQYMTGDPDDELECNCQFRCILKLHLKELTLLYSVATDAVDQTLHQDNINLKDMKSFVTLKTVRERDSQWKQYKYKKFTLIAWWVEGQLSGVPRVLSGNRDLDGVVQTLQMLQIADMPDEAEGEWKPRVCINFLTKFLNYVKEKVVSDPSVVHRFERLALDGNYIRHFHDTNETDILPSWYTQQLFACPGEPTP